MLGTLGGRAVGALATLALVLATASCGGGSKHKSAAAGNRVPVETTTTNPYQVPATIDAAYVQRVLGALDRLDGQVARSATAAKALSADAVRLLQAKYGDPELKYQLVLWQQNVTQHLADFREEPGDPVSKVLQVITVRGACVFTKVDRDYTPWYAVPRATDRLVEYVTLKPAPSGASPANPTPWIVASSAFNKDGSPTEDLCAAS